MFNQQSALFGEDLPSVATQPVNEEIHAEVRIPAKRKTKEKSIHDSDQIFAVQSATLMGIADPDAAPFDSFDEHGKGQLWLHRVLLRQSFVKLVHNQMSEEETLMTLEWVLSESIDAFSFRMCCAAEEEPYEVYRSAIFQKLHMDPDDVRALIADRIASNPNWIEADLDDLDQVELRYVRAATH